MQDKPVTADDRQHPSNQQHMHLPQMDGRATLGFLTADIHIGFSRTLLFGIADAAEQHGMNLLCFPGGGLHATTGFEAQRNVIYDLVDPAYLYGLVSWSSSITGSLEPTDATDFYQRYRSLPLVNMTQPVQGIP